MNRFLVACLGTLLLVGSTRSAGAATILLDQCNTAGLCNQVSVTTSLVGSAIDVDVLDVAGAPAFGIFGQTGANRSFGFNVSGSVAGVSFSNFTSGFGYAGAAVHNMGGGFGDFEFVINGPQQGSNATLPLHFRVTRTDGFSSDLDLFEANLAGYYFNSHVRNNETGLTGFAASNTPPKQRVPEPVSTALLGFGVAAAAVRRFRSR